MAGKNIRPQQWKKKKEETAQRENKTTKVNQIENKQISAQMTIENWREQIANEWRALIREWR